MVPQNIIDEIKRRGVNGAVHLHDNPLGKGEPVRIVEGPSVVSRPPSDRYLSGAERAAILLHSVEVSGLRDLCPISAVARRKWNRSTSNTEQVWRGRARDGFPRPQLGLSSLGAATTQLDLAAHRGLVSVRARNAK